MLGQGSGRGIELKGKKREKLMGIDNSVVIEGGE